MVFFGDNKMDNLKLNLDPWIKMQQAYLLQEKLINNAGYKMTEVNPLFIDVYVALCAQPQTTTQLTRLWYFERYSLSTMKRAIVWLLDNRLISQSVGSDKRERVLYSNAGVIDE